MRQLFPVQYTRELRLAWRGPVDALLPFGFFVAAAAMFPLGVGPEPHALRQLAPGLIWVCALLGTLLSLDALYTGDDTDDTLEQLVLTGHNVPSSRRRARPRTGRSPGFRWFSPRWSSACCST